MATEAQIAANRRNARKSTGPRTQEGKQRSRQNAFQHGLTAETVISVLENAGDYELFAEAIITDYQPVSTVEYELIARLASLLWRLRRATAIESGLFDMQGRIVRERRQFNASANENEDLRVFHDLLMPYEVERISDVPVQDRSGLSPELALCFLRLGNFTNGILELIGRYETRLWRQVAQIILLLASARKSHLDSTKTPESPRY